MPTWRISIKYIIVYAIRMSLGGGGDMSCIIACICIAIPSTAKRSRIGRNFCACRLDDDDKDFWLLLYCTAARVKIVSNRSTRYCVVIILQSLEHNKLLFYAQSARVLLFFVRFKTWSTMQIILHFFGDR